MEAKELGAFIAQIRKENQMTEFGIAGEKAEKNSSGPGSFQVELFDQFYNLTQQDIF